MAIAPLPESKQLELQLLDLPWPRPQLRLVRDTAYEAGTGGSEYLVPRPAPLAGFSHGDEAPTPVELVGTAATEDQAVPAPRRQPSVRVRRRRQQVAVALAGVATLAIVFAGPLGSSGRTPGSAPVGGSLPVQTVAGQTFYTVQPGDTLASIAQRMDPADPSAETAHLAGLLGSGVVVVGEHIPASIS